MDRTRSWLKENTRRYAFKKLKREIIDPGVCVECGSCVDSCPVDALTGEMSSGKYVPTLTGECVSCGVCYAMCPRTFSLWSDIAGNFRSIWKSRSVAEHKGQDGGVVTTILSYLLRRRIIDAAVVACRGGPEEWLPEARLITDPDDLSRCAGTVYTHAPVVGKMVEAFKKGVNAVGIVGTSCDIDALERMKRHPAGYFNVDRRRSVFSIGLFCMESFEYPKLKEWLGERDVNMVDVLRFAISSGEFRVTLESGEKTWPISELSSAASTSCSYCHDLTSVNADVSCGNIGSDEGYTTVILRSIQAEQVFQELVAEGEIQAELVDEKSMVRIQNIARSKRYRYYGLKPKH
jgi:coenzyme F420 hydrogenase subunit beta